MKIKLISIFLTAALIFTLAGCKRNPVEPEGFIVTHKYATPEQPMPFNDITASELVSKIHTGWNLGNTLDTAHLTWLGRNPTVTQMETAWGNPVTAKANIAALKNAGFNAIRIPVSWSKAAGNDYIIRTDWMERVVEIVNWAIEYDMYVILNTHHDEDIFGFTNSKMDESKIAFTKIWQQIAAVFKNYDEKLLFEALNEPRTPGSSHEWRGGTFEEHVNLNTYYQLFVDIVRASGGNNGKRMLVINTYAASGEAAAINALVMPNDTVKDKLIASVHCYSPYNFALNLNMALNTWDRNNEEDTLPVTTPIDRAFNAFTSKNIPVIMGEFGAMNKDNMEDRVQWAEFYTSYAKEKGMPCFWWDNGVVTGENAERFGLLDRRTNRFVYPEIVDALMRGSKAVIGAPVDLPTGPMPVIYLPRNQWSPGFQTQFDIVTYLNGDKITTGDAFSFDYSFTANIDIDSLSFVLVDATEQANWWTELSPWIDLGKITAGDQIKGSVTINAFETATSTSAAANKLVFDATEETESPPTLTFTAFSFWKN